MGASDHGRRRTRPTPGSRDHRSAPKCSTARRRTPATDERTVVPAVPVDPRAAGDGADRDDDETGPPSPSSSRPSCCASAPWSSSCWRRSARRRSTRPVGAACVRSTSSRSASWPTACPPTWPPSWTGSRSPSTAPHRPTPSSGWPTPSWWAGSRGSSTASRPRWWPSRWRPGPSSTRCASGRCPRDRTRSPADPGTYL